jgi:four helix bundle protein
MKGKTILNTRKDKPQGRPQPVLRRSGGKPRGQLEQAAHPGDSRHNTRPPSEPTTKVWRRDRTPSQQPARRFKSEGELLQTIALSQGGPGGYKKFSDIPAHKLGKALRGRLYQVANSLPEDERGNLTGRIKYSATTVTAALAQGFGESTFRASMNRALESRGALMAVCDHIEQLGELGLLDPEFIVKLKEQIDAVIAALNEYLGSLAREQQQLRSA